MKLLFLGIVVYYLAKIRTLLTSTMITAIPVHFHCGVYQGLFKLHGTITNGSHQDYQIIIIKAHIIFMTIHAGIGLLVQLLHKQQHIIMLIIIQTILWILVKQLWDWITHLLDFIKSCFIWLPILIAGNKFWWTLCAQIMYMMEIHA